MKRKKYPIPDWCKPDCKWRDKEATHMPACQNSITITLENGKCLNYKKDKRVVKVKDKGGLKMYLNKRAVRKTIADEGRQVGDSFIAALDLYVGGIITNAMLMSQGGHERLTAETLHRTRAALVSAETQASKPSD